MRNLTEFKGFLTDRGGGVYNLLRNHCEGLGIWNEGFTFELAMLANSFDLYYSSALFCNDPKNGMVMTFETEKGTYSQVRPEYTVMKNEYGNILKHGAKFGLNPADLKRVFDKLEDDKKEQKKGFDTGPMRAVK